MDPEMSTIIQAGIICGFLELQTLIFFLFPIFSDYLPNGCGVYLNIFQNCAVIIANSMNPIIFYGFNTEIRRRVQHIFGYLKIRKVSVVGMAT